MLRNRRERIMMKHTIKFANIQEMLEWIIENNFYEVTPVDLTIQLGE